MLKIFISQPMRGKTQEEILKERNNAIKFIKEKYHDNVEIIDSYFIDFTPDAKPLLFLSRSIEKLAEADLAVFIGNWEIYRGCKIEHNCCKEYGIATEYFD